MALSPAAKQGNCRRWPARFVLFKQSVITAHDSHFAGGKHAFLSMATALAEEGFDVHVVSIATRGKVLVHAGMVGLLPFLSFAKPGVVTWRERKVNYHVILRDEPSGPGSGPPAVPDSSSGPEPAGAAALAAVVSSYVGSLARVKPPASPPAPPHGADVTQISQQAAPETAGGSDGGRSGLLRCTCTCSSSSWVIIDADESQKLLPLQLSTGTGKEPAAASPGPAAAAAVDQSPPPPSSEPPFPAGRCQPGSTTAAAANNNNGTAALNRQSMAAAAATTLFESIVTAVPPRRCLSYVQNVHFLPMGPSGTGPRRPELLAAWARLGAVLAVSEFIADYVRQHWPQVVPAVVAVAPPPVRVIPLAAWGAFGKPPFPDLAGVARPLLQAWRAAQAPGAVPAPAPVEAAAPAMPEGAPPAAAAAAPPVVKVAVLKLTPEKGASIVVELARRLAGRVQFRVVCGDPTAAAALAPLTKPCAVESDCNGGDGSVGSSPGSGFGGPAAAASAAPLELWEPQPDVSAVLRGCVAVLAPSLWLEAWGMVVTEALLRGLPALVSDLGGLPEAGMRLCPAVPVEPILIPPDGDGVPDWAARSYPKQDVGAWERALLALLIGHSPETAPTAAAAAKTAPTPTARGEAGSPSDGTVCDGPDGGAGNDGDDVGGTGNYGVELQEGDGGGGGSAAEGGGGAERDRGSSDPCENGAVCACACAWERLSRAGREAALQHVYRGPGFREEWLGWLEELRGPCTCVCV